MEIDNLGRMMSGAGVLIAVLGLGFTIVVVAGVFFLLFRLFRGMGRANAERNRLLREGVRASARILNVEMGGMTMTVGVHRHLQLKLTVQVEPSGIPPYETVLTAMISELQIPQVQPGVAATVRYDANDPRQVVLESVGAIALPVGAAPKMPVGAKIGLVVGGLGALVGIGAAIIAVIVAVGVGGFAATGGGFRSPKPRPSGDDICLRAIRCCEIISGDSASHCSGLGNFGVSSSACEATLSSYQRAARAMGKTCK